MNPSPRGLAGLSIRRPVAVTIVFTIITVLGIISLGRTPLDLMPEINFPIAAIITTYEGAGPQEIEDGITRPIESAVATLEGLESIMSTSERGQSLVVAQFAFGSDMDMVALDLREAIDVIKPFLPDDADEPLVVRFTPSSIPVIAVTIGGNRTPEDLRALADDIIQPRLERIEGVASVSVNGGSVREIQVDLHPGRMQVQQVALESVTQALVADNRNQPGGSIQHQGREYTMRTTGEFKSVADIEELRIPTGAGVAIPLRQIATVTDGYKESPVLTRLNFAPAVGLSIQKESDANTVQVARAVRKELERLREELGGDVELSVVFDQAEMIEDSIRSVANNGLMGALIASAVLLLFLHNVRAIVIVVISIPLSVIATFMLIYFSGMTLNIISLGGLALGVGMLVDNTIVVLENIFRHLKGSGDPREAAEKGTNEVAAAVIASTLTTVSVFVPVLFVQGLAKQIFLDMSLTVSFSLAMSLVVSLTLVPVMASRWLGNQRRAAPDVEDKGWLKDAYGRLLVWALRRRRLVLAVVTVLFVGSLAMVPMIGGEFLPASDQGIINVSIELPVGATRDETDQVVRYLEESIYALSEVESVYARVGAGASGGEMPEVATIDVTLVPLAQRSRSVFEVAEAIRGLARRIAGASISVTIADALSAGFGMGAGAAAPIQVQLFGDDEEALAALANQLARAIEGIEGAREVSTSLDDQRPEYRVEIRRERARELGLTLPQIASAVRTAVEGQVVTQYRTGGEEIDVRVRMQAGSDWDLDALARVPIMSPTAGMVPLAEVVRFVQGSVPSTLQRQDQSRVVTVSADVFERPLSAVMADVSRAVDALELPQGVSVRFGGDVQEMIEAFGDLGTALILAVFLVYAVMAAQFESFRHPFTIMFSVPLAGIGVIFGLVVTGTPLSVASFIGLIMLAGIVVNNAIVLVDFINQQRQAGVEREQAIVTAGRTRLRPVLMTTLTTVLGMIPLALGIGEGSELEAPLAIVVIFGLSFSTLLTLVIVPLVYVSIDNLGKGRIARLFSFRRGRKPEVALGAKQS